MSEMEEKLLTELNRIAREAAASRELLGKLVFAMINQAEAEVPESMRRFVTYMHDIHDITYMYEQRGLPIPRWILQEMERCDDRFRQLLEKHHTDGGAFEKVRREMAADPLNRWDHTRLLDKPKENGRETG
jgi:hypothetical protein